MYGVESCSSTHSLSQSDTSAGGGGEERRPPLPPSPPFPACSTAFRPIPHLPPLTPHQQPHHLPTPADKTALLRRVCADRLWQFLVDMLEDEVYGAVVTWAERPWDIKIETALFKIQWNRQNFQEKVSFHTLSRRLASTCPLRTPAGDMPLIARGHKTGRWTLFPGHHGNSFPLIPAECLMPVRITRKRPADSFHEGVKRPCYEQNHAYAMSVAAAHYGRKYLSSLSPSVPSPALSDLAPWPSPFPAYPYWPSQSFAAFPPLYPPVSYPTPAPSPFTALSPESSPRSAPPAPSPYLPPSPPAEERVEMKSVVPKEKRDGVESQLAEFVSGFLAEEAEPEEAERLKSATPSSSVPSCVASPEERRLKQEIRDDALLPNFEEFASMMW